MPQRQAHDSIARDPRDGRRIEGPLGIIAGGGLLPCLIADSAAARGLDLHIVGIRGEASEEIERFPHTWIKWGEIGKLFTALDGRGCRDLVIIGGVTRPDPANIRLDLGAIRNLPFLVSLGIDASRMEVISYGLEKAQGTSEGSPGRAPSWANDRRADSIYLRGGDPR